MDERGGRPSEGGAPWGYRDLTIPLNVREGLTDRRSRGQVEGIIEQQLAAERDRGWEPDEPVDLSTLRRNNRIQFKFGWFHGATYISASIRLRRQRQDEELLGR